MIRKCFPASEEALSDALAFVEETLEAVGCPMKAMMQVSVCVEEMFVNVARYAYDGEGGEVTLTVDGEGGVVSIELADDGVPFDPLAKEDPDITLSADDRAVGGLGIFMVKKSMNEVCYRRENGRNIFTMKKYLNRV